MSRGLIVGLSTVLTAVCLSMFTPIEDAQAGWRHRCGGWRAGWRCAGWRHRCAGVHHQAACCGVAAAPVMQPGCCVVDGTVHSMHHGQPMDAQYPPAPGEADVPPAPQEGPQAPAQPAEAPSPAPEA